MAEWILDVRALQKSFGPHAVLKGIDLRVATSPRTGVGGAGAVHPWRLHIVGESSVSPYRPAVPRRRVRTR